MMSSGIKLLLIGISLVFLIWGISLARADQTETTEVKSRMTFTIQLVTSTCRE